MYFTIEQMRAASLSTLSHILRPGIAVIGIALMSACAAQPPQSAATPYDPHEAQNRKVHERSKRADINVVRPIAIGYSNAVPDDIETMVSRFAFNTSLPQSVVNNTLRGNMKAATEDLYRFIVNTTVGLGGLFDPATELDMPAASEADFGMVLHAWGVPQGAYQELPLLGPSTQRHTAGRIVDLFTNPLSYVIPSPESYIVTGSKISSRLSERGRYADTIDGLLYESADSYAQLRSLYLQKRAFELEGPDGDAYLDPYDSAFEDPYDE